mgnify:CR=1 FL=1
MTRILTEHDIEAVVTLDDCIEVVEQVFRAYGEGKMEKSQSLGMTAGQGTVHVKAATAGVFAAKINANFPRNRELHGLPTIQGVIVVMDIDRGTPLGILDSGLITTLRTAAATAVAAKFLARHDASTVAVIGCGAQGRATLEALRRVRNIDRVFAFDVDESAARGLSEVIPARSIDDAVASADIIVTCTTSRSALLDARHFRPGLLIAGVGADNPGKNELAPDLLARALVVPDLLDQAAAMGDLHHAIAAGAMTREQIYAELPDVICGRAAPRTSAGQTFVFDSTGTALQDVVVAELALDRAAGRGVGWEIALR